MNGDFLEVQIKSNIDVSVIVPMHNAERTILPTLETIRSQTLKNIEIVLVDDFSHDHTVSIVKSIMELDSRIKLIELSENVGVYKARAIGVTSSLGEWIGFVDADDFIKPCMYERMHASAIFHTADVVICEVDRVDRDRKYLSPKVRFKKNQLVTSDILKKFTDSKFKTGSLCNKLYRRELFIKWITVELPIRPKINEDVLVNIGVFKEARSVFLLKHVLYEYVLNRESVTCSQDNASAFLSIIKSYLLMLHVYDQFDEADKEKFTNRIRKQLNSKSCRLNRLEISNYDVDGLKPLLQEIVLANPARLFDLIYREPKQEISLFGLNFGLLLSDLKNRIRAKVVRAYRAVLGV